MVGAKSESLSVASAQNDFRAIRRCEQSAAGGDRIHHSHTGQDGKTDAVRSSYLSDDANQRWRGRFFFQNSFPDIDFVALFQKGIALRIRRDLA